MGTNLAKLKIFYGGIMTKEEMDSLEKFTFCSPNFLAIAVC